MSMGEGVLLKSHIYQAQEVGFQTTLVIVYITIRVTQTSIKKHPRQ